MSYIYVIKKGEQVLGVCSRKYGITQWAKDKTETQKEDVYIVRYGDYSTYDRNKDLVRFTLEEYLSNPDKQYR